MKRTAIIFAVSLALVIAAIAGFVIYSQPRTAAAQLARAQQVEQRALPRLLSLKAAITPDGDAEHADLLEQVITEYARVGERFPDAGEVGEAEFRIYGVRDSNTSGAEERIALARKYLEVHPNSPHKADVDWRIAELTHKELKKHLDAIKLYEAFARDHDEDERASEALFRVGGIYEEIREWASANDAYEKVVREFPESKHADDAQFRVGNILAERLERKEEAAAAFQQLEEKFPDSRLAEAARGQREALEEQGAKSASEEYAKKYYGGVRERKPWDSVAGELDSPVMKQLRAQPLDLQSVDAAVDLDPDGGIFSATATMTATATGEVSGTLIFQLGEDVELSTLEAAGEVRPFTRQGNFVVVTLPDSLVIPAGDVVAVKISYKGIGDPKAMMDTVTSTSTFLVSRSWLPTLNFGDATTAELSITAPSRYVVQTQGTIVSTEESGTSTTRKFSSKIPVFYHVLVAAPYSTRTGKSGDLPIEVMLLEGTDEKYFDGYLEELPRILEFLEGRLGPFPYEKLVVAEVERFPGGMGSPGLIMIGSRAFETTGTPASFLAHEVSHAWFGNLLGIDLSSDSIPWLSEGFAQYWDALYLEHKEGRPAFVRHMRTLAENYYTAISVLDDRPVRTTPIGDQVYSALAYDKGAFILHALRGMVGDEKFFGLMRSHVDANRGKIVTVAAFREAAEAAAGEALDWFFEQWLDKKGIPRYRMRRATLVTPTGAAGHAVEVEIEQVGQTFRMPLDIEAETDGQPERQRVLVADTITTVTMETRGKPTRVVIDPDYWVLKHPRSSEWDKNVTGGGSVDAPAAP